DEPGEVRERVVAPVVIDLAANAGQRAIRGVPQIVDAGTSFHAAAPDVERYDVFGAGTAERVELLGRQERVRAVDRIGHEEGTGGSDLREAPVVHEHELGVALEMLVYRVTAEDAARVALVRALEVIQRAEVVRGAVPFDELVALDGVVGVDEVREQALRVRR